MLKELVRLVMGFFDGLEVRLRWSLLTGLIAVVVLLLVGVECFTGFAYYGSLQRKANLLKELNALARDDIAAKPELYPIYEQIVAELEWRKIPLIGVPTLSPSVAFWKFLTGSSFGLVLTLLALVGTFGDRNRTIGAVSMLIFAALMGYLGTLIPTIGSPLVNYFGFPLAQVVGLLVLSRGSKKGRQSEGQG